ncbi:redoxin family protein [Schlesneria paludicola]|uniref:redoxin family protein n=1 Tax=Schlesneria paludicola TaxID=360056 RepID=UPI00029B4C9C|nr:redoxin family protein [Schlesneria paludicola]
MRVFQWNSRNCGWSSAIAGLAIWVAVGAAVIADEPLPGISVEIPSFSGPVLLNDVPVDATDTVELDDAELDDGDLDLNWNGLAGKQNHDITIAGRALDEAGKPIAGARIFVVSVAASGMPLDDRPVLAETKADAEGNYRCERVRLTVLEFTQTAVPKPSEGLFQVFGVAEGYGYTWRRTGAYRPVARPKDDDATPPPPNKKGLTVPSKPPIILESDGDGEDFDTDAKSVFFAEEPIAIDLAFAPEVKLHGTIRDDLGTPLKGAVIQAGLISSNRSRPGALPDGWSGSYLEGTPHAADGSFSGYFALPEEFRQTTTDEQGRYEIRGLPRDCRLLAHLDYLPEFDPWTGTLTTGAATAAGQGPRQQAVGYEGTYNHVFIAPVTVNVKVVGTTGQPVANAIVRHEAKNGVCRAGGLDRTDANGLATLKLRPGKARVLVEPAIGVEYLPGQETISFSKVPREQQIEIALAPAAEVIFEAVEKETGKPIADIGFLSEPSEVPERKPVQSQISFVDHPRTDRNGRLRAFFAPGERRFFVKLPSSEYEPIAPTTEPITLSTSQPTHLRFEFSRRPLATVKSDQERPFADELKPLSDLLQQQSDRFEQSRRACFEVSHTNYIPAKKRLSQTQLTKLLESFPSKPLDECLKSLGITGTAFSTLTTDGFRRRVDSGKSEHAHINAFNGEETIISMGNEQLDIYSASSSPFHFLDHRDLWHLPNRKVILENTPLIAAQLEPQRTVHHVNGTWDVELQADKTLQRWVIDDSTGFLRRSVVAYSQTSGNEIWQFFPVTMTTGICVPGLTVKFQYQNGKIVRQEVYVIENVEILSELPAETFLVSAPAGTNIIDYRGLAREEMHLRRPPSGVVSSDIPDVVAYRNRFAPAAPPVLRVGDVAPVFNVVTWLDANGRTEPPRFDGKVVVIDFWGIGCGPCVAGLPVVNQAAKHFSNSSIVIVGLHDCGSDLDGVAAFAKKRGLTFPIAIDQPNPKAQSFGTTFSAFGIDAMPTSVVIDQKGKVAYIGAFENAIEVANGLNKRE